MNKFDLPPVMVCLREMLICLNLSQESEAYVLKVLEAWEWLSQNASSALPQKHEFVPCGGGSKSSPGEGTGTMGLWGAMAWSWG